MKKIIYQHLLFSGILLLAFACSSNDVRTVNSFKEPDDPSPLNPLEWKSVTKFLNVSVVSIDKRFSKHSVPNTEKTLSWFGEAWKGEKLNAQIVLWSAKALEDVHCTSSDLLDAEGNTIDAKNIGFFFVRYVLSDEFANGCGNRSSIDFDSLLVADALDPTPYFAMEANTARPVWFTISVPENCIAGNYKGTLVVEAKKQKKMEIEINVLVTDNLLPKPQDWSFHLDLWQNPFSVARYYNVEVWSEEHFKLLKPLMEMLADAGQKCITASIMPNPWGGQTFDPFESMIQWKKNENGSWSYDYTHFDNWIDFQMECGISKQINCYTMIPWGNRFSYFDEATNKDTTITTTPGTAAYRALWTPFLKQFMEHLKEKGWEDMTTIAMDERSVEEMQAMIAFVHTIAPDLKLTLAGGYHEEISNDIYDLSVASQTIVAPEAIQQRVVKGLHTTYYVCCKEPYPNNFTFSPPAESAYMGWYAAANGYDGFLRWAYNSWVEHPLTDSRFRSWPAGDTYFVYPGLSSIRFERLREGIQDYEKIRILKKELLDNPSKVAAMKLELLEEVLKTFIIPELKYIPAGQFVNKGKKIIAELSANNG